MDMGLESGIRKQSSNTIAFTFTKMLFGKAWIHLFSRLSLLQQGDVLFQQNIACLHDAYATQYALQYI